MENNLTAELPKQNESNLLHWGMVAFLFFMIVGLVNLVYFKDIYLPSEGRAEDFEFYNFLIYNLGLKLFLYLFKFVGLVGLFMMGAFLFKIGTLKFLDILKVVIIAELVKYLPEVIEILWFTFIDSASLEGYDLYTFYNYLSLNGLLGITKENAIHPLLNYISITQLLYVLAVAKLLQMSDGDSFGKHLHWSGTTYGLAILLIGLGAVVLAL